MGSCTAFWGGFSSFFSIWQLCLLQISPFFMAFAVGMFLAACGQKDNLEIDQWIALPFFAYVVGFAAFYSLLIATGLTASKFLLYYINSLRVASGFMILIAGIYIQLSDRLGIDGTHRSLPFASGVSLLTGISFAFIYAPCITPTMSEIMALASQRATAIEGWYLALAYGTGICAAFGITALGLVLVLGNSVFVMRNVRLMKNHCSAVVFVLALLNMTGLMRHYKAMILGSVL